MKLYEINDLIEKTMLEGVDRETGEISPELDAKLDALEIERTEKIRQVMLYMKGEQAEAEGIGAILKQLRARKAVHDAHVSWLRDYLERHTNEGDDVKDPRGRVYYKQSPGRVEFEVGEGTDIDSDWIWQHVDQRFLSREVVIKVDKGAAAKAMRAGNQVRGLRLAKPKLFTIE